MSDMAPDITLHDVLKMLVEEDKEGMTACLVNSVGAKLHFSVIVHGLELPTPGSDTVQ